MLRIERAARDYLGRKLDKRVIRLIYLIWELTTTDFRLKYSSTVLGFFWSLLNPLLIFAVLYVIFSMFIRIDVPQYPLFLFLGILMWNFFMEGTLNGMSSLANKPNLVRKVNTSKPAIVLSACINSFMTFILNMAVFFVFCLVLRAKIGLMSSLILVMAGILLLIILALSLILSAYYARYKDLKHIWAFLLNAGFWITPVVYPITLVPQKYIPLYMLNPLARIITYSRRAVIYNSPPNPWGVFALAVFSALLLIICFRIFRKKSPHFADYI
ncbi:sugar ABC transporter permease [Candidatus Woesearchaeota archaeon CG10_big_fil_rev_8_21_14_0_10_44_13]|nr:MAG: sugar ABC transporter permease [Candidatus Woesearchaeota archaeon CG10_big_fil_rev_8_21_14_0_10_44_13]